MSDTSSKKTKYILITNGESYVGQTLALYIADQLHKGDGQLKSKHRRVRVLCKNKSNLKHLEKKGIEVREVDYDSQHTLCEEMKVHVKTMIFNPFAKKERMVEHGKNIIDAALREKVKRVVMISSMGADKQDCHSPETSLGQFFQLEHHLRQCYQYGFWAIMRIPFIQQYMYFWSDMLHERGVLGMPISRSDSLITVNMKDVVECLAVASLSKKSIVWSKADTSDGAAVVNDETTHGIKMIYELVSTMPMTFDQMSVALTEALRKSGSSLHVHVSVLTDDQLKNYLKHVAQKKSSSHHHQPLESVLVDIKRESSINTEQDQDQEGVQEIIDFIRNRTFTGQHNDNPYLYPSPVDTLTPFCINLILDHFKTARNNVPMMPLGSDVKDITGRESIHLVDFFMSNRNQFRPDESVGSSSSSFCTIN